MKKIVISPDNKKAIALLHELTRRKRELIEKLMPKNLAVKAREARKAN